MINIMNFYCETNIRPLEEKISFMRKKALKKNMFSFFYKRILIKYEKSLFNKYAELGNFAKIVYNYTIK